MGSCIYADSVRIEASRTYRILKDRYESLVDAHTYCQKCAFMEDIHGKTLCKSCGQKWHDPKYAKCYDCFRADRERNTPGDMFN